ncbi:MAG: hypothetical protein AB1449_13005 [Chloroflexota bacterium]
MLWSQLIFATLLSLFGLASPVYGSRAFTGLAWPPSWYFIRRSRFSREPASQESMLAALLAFLMGTIAILGGLGLILTALI